MFLKHHGYLEIQLMTGTHDKGFLGYMRKLDIDGRLESDKAGYPLFERQPIKNECFLENFEVCLLVELVRLIVRVSKDSSSIPMFPVGVISIHEILGFTFVPSHFLEQYKAIAAT